MGILTTSLPVRERGLKSDFPLNAACKRPVAPRAGAWIEIAEASRLNLEDVSLPVRERGLKYMAEVLGDIDMAVAPRAGAWIEIGRNPAHRYKVLVAPRAGAWIEIRCLRN